MENIVIKGLTQNNLKNVSLTLPKNKIIVFTGVSGSGKSSIVFDTIASEAARQLNETYPAFVRSRMPKYEKPKAELLENLSPPIIVDQAALSGNMRSTVGTASELYTMLRLLFSRIGEPYTGSASAFSFNDPQGMCPVCGGLGWVTDIDVDAMLDKTKSLRNGGITDKLFKTGAWYWKQYMNSGLFDVDKPLQAYTTEEYNTLLYGAPDGTSAPLNPKVEGIYNFYKRIYLTRDLSRLSAHQKEKSEKLVSKKLCPSCHGKRLNRRSASARINGYTITELSDMEFTKLRSFLMNIDDKRVTTIIDGLVLGLTRMIDIGLPYLSLSRETPSLSGGEAQRLKLVRFLGSSLNGMMYIFDEPSTGMHPRDVYRMNNLLKALRDRGNTVLVVEHDKDVIGIADVVVDVGPGAGKAGGNITFLGSYDELKASDTLTGRAINQNAPIKQQPREPKGFLPIRGATLHNLKSLDVDIPLGVVCVVTGVAGSGKSSLISGVFAEQYKDEVIRIDQSPITATGRSTPSSFLGFFDRIRKLFAAENNVSEGLLSFNSDGACPVCKGKGVIITELAFMDPMVTTCEACGGSRYSDEALSCTYKGKNIVEVLDMTAEEAYDFFDDSAIKQALKSLIEVGLSYMTLGQPLSTLSGGERQRLKLAKNLKKKGSIYILDEPTTGLHPSDTKALMKLFNSFVDRGNTVIIIEHNLDVMKQADYIIDIGPDGGRNGGRLVFSGTPQEMIEQSDTITAICLRADALGKPLSQQELQSLTGAGYDENEEDDMAGLRLYPIGRIINDEEGCYVELNQEYRQALDGLSGFSHVQVYWWFDGCDNERDRAVITNKKPYTNGPDTMGTFATRSPMRPNPIAVTTAAVTWIDAEHGTLGLSFTDALDSTPVLDIKPYTPSLDRVGDPAVPGWCSHWPKTLEESGEFDWESEFNF